MTEGAANWYQDVGFPLYQKYWTGPVQIDSQYGPDRFGVFTTEIVWGLYNSTGGAVNYLSGNWLKNRALFDIYEFLPTSGNGKHLWPRLRYVEPVSAQLVETGRRPAIFADVERQRRSGVPQLLYAADAG